MKRTIAIILIIIAAVGLGYVYEMVLLYIEKEAYPLQYEEFVEKYSLEYNVPKEIIYSIIKTESGFRSNAESFKDGEVCAIGLMQITPDTFDWLVSKTGEIHDKGMLYDPKTNIKYGTYFLRYLFLEFGDLQDNWNLVFAAYNAGLNRVKNDWMRNPEYIQDGIIMYIPFNETREYIEKVNNSIKIYRRLYFKDQ